MEKKRLNDLLLFKLSQAGFALNSDLLFIDRYGNTNADENDLDKLSHGDKIFVCQINIAIDDFVNMISKKNMKFNFYIMHEPVVSVELIEKLLPYSVNIYCQNNEYMHERVHCMPIGIRDCERVCPEHKAFTHDYLYNEGLKTVDKNILCLLCFSYTHDERYRCYFTLREKDFVVNLNDYNFEKQPSVHCGKVPVWINYEITHKSHYVLCPRGCGEDTHRFYEAIYLDCIPIVKRTNKVFDKLYDTFPCLVVDDWNDVSQELLQNNLVACTQKLQMFKKMYPNIYTDIQDIEKLLQHT
jgi:hypothetical protein